MPPKKEEPKVKPFEEIIFILLTIFLIGSVIMRLEDILAANGENNLWARFLSYFITHLWPIIRLVGAIITAACFVGIWHSMRSLGLIAAKERAIFGPTSQELNAERSGEPIPKNDAWERVLTLINSPNSSDWRLAVIEADIMLDDLLTTLGYTGVSLGDRLKAVDKSDMLTLDNAWEAHKVRNNIAHTPNYELTERDAKRAVRLYESVFKEFEII